MSHDCHPLTCEECARDLAQITRCRTCDGAGYVEVEHHLYGRPNCPDPTETVPCPECGSAA